MPSAHAPTPDAGRDAVQAIRAAFEQTVIVRRLGNLTVYDEAANRLRDAVDAARDAGVAWGQIGDALGIARGNAYQRYRHPPGTHGK